jgi:Na+/H+ antiporter NhaD/arsenite permease-like protein
VLAVGRLPGFRIDRTGAAIIGATLMILLAAVVFVSGFFSAFFVNDTMCLVLTPLVLEVAGLLRRKPAPYLLAVAMGANIGSVATRVGAPLAILTIASGVWLLG